MVMVATGRTRRWRTAAEIWGSYGGAPRPTVGGLTKGAVVRRVSGRNSGVMRRG